MEENKDTEKGLACPFCSAPQRDVVPSDAAQVKCEYCGSIFPVSPYLKDTISRCPNHPEAFATGLCNDCGGNFCMRCLYEYELKTEGASARLYLCSKCLRGRHLKQANAYVLIGLLVLSAEILVLVSPVQEMIALGTLFVLLFSIPFIAYGLYKRSSLQEEPSVYDEKESISKSKEVSELAQDIDVDVLYGKMLGKYMMRWGAINAKEMLDSEIYAHIRHGLDYNEAVRRVARAKGIITAESVARVKAEVEAETEREEEPKETRKSRMVR